MVELLAKPDKSLLEHSLEVVELSKELVKEFDIDKNLKKRIILASALHDIGKGTTSFQEYIRGKRNKAFPHALASFPFVYVVEMKLYEKPILASAAVVSHHTPLREDVFSSYGKPEYLKSEIYDFLKKLSEEMGIDFLSLIRGMEKLIFDTEPSKVFNTVKNSNSLQNLDPIDYSAVKTSLNLSDWISSGDVKRRITLNNKLNMIINYMEKKNFSLREFQGKAEKIAKDIYLKAPTGTGKTEALLLWSKGNRLLYLLPTQATVNSMWKRLQNIYGKENVGLAHGRSSLVLRKLSEFDDEKDDSVWGEILFSSVFAKPINVATLDQYLIAALHGRRWENKAFLTAKSDMVIDEIHSYDAYTLGLLIGALKLFPPKKISIASATFPKALYNLLSNEIGKNIEVVAERNLWRRKRHRILLHDSYLMSSIGAAIEDAKKGKNILIIANTVQDAQDIFRIVIEEGYPEEKRALMHSRFIYRDREEKEGVLSDFIENPDKKFFILVSTQVVEVSLDISFDVLYTEIAPIDSLVQRLGRVNRKGEKGISDVHIFKKYREKSAKVYGKETLDKSIELLESLAEIPEEIEFLRINDELYKYIFSKEFFKEKYLSGKEKVEDFHRIFGTYTISLADEKMRKKFFTRETSAITESVIPCIFKEEASAYIENGEKWKIPELMVSVPAWWLKDVETESILPYVSIANIKYSKEFGATKEKDERCLNNIL